MDFAETWFVMKQVLEHAIVLSKAAYFPLSQKAISLHNFLNTPRNIRLCQFYEWKACHGKFMY